MFSRRHFAFIGAPDVNLLLLWCILLLLPQLVPRIFVQISAFLNSKMPEQTSVDCSDTLTNFNARGDFFSHLVSAHQVQVKGNITLFFLSKWRKSIVVYSIQDNWLFWAAACRWINPITEGWVSVYSVHAHAQTYKSAQIPCTVKVMQTYSNVFTVEESNLWSSSCHSITSPINPHHWPF